MARSKDAPDELPDGWNTWLRIGEATRLLRTNYKQIEKLAAEGSIRRIECPDQVTRYNPEDVQAAAVLFEPEAKPGLSHDEFRAGTELVKQVLSHHEKMVPLVVSGFSSMIVAAEGRVKAMADELVAKNLRISELEKERDETAKAREKSISEEHTRLLAEKSVEAAERRKDKAFTAVTEKFAPLLLQKLGVGDPKMQIGSELLSTIKRDQLLGLLAIGVLDEKQVALVLRLLQPLTAEEREALKSAGVIKDPAPASSEAKGHATPEGSPTNGPSPKEKTK